MTERRFWIILAVVAAGVGGIVAVQTRSAEREAAMVAEQVRKDESARQATAIPAVAQTLRALKLITVEIHTSVESVSADDSWRGDVLASVRAPVTLYYGVDLSSLTSESIRVDPLTGSWSIRVPRPVRLATEVLGTDEQAEVRVTGTRLRDVAGEYHLGIARTSMYERARRMTLSGAERQKLEAATREQIVRLVTSIAGPSREVRVDLLDSEGFAVSPTEPGATP